MTAAEQKKSLPDHYSPIMPYLVVKDAEGFIKFIKTVFNAEEKLRVNMLDGSLMHGEYTINGGTIMLGETGDNWPPFPAPMYLVTGQVDEIYKLGIENVAEGNMEPQDKDYGRAAGFVDKWGNQWWLNEPSVPAS
jgi:PhnB protein